MRKNIFAMTGLTRFLAALVVIAIAGCSGVRTGTVSGLSGYTESGKASFYADSLHLNKTASGEPYNRNLKTAAHRRLPFGTRVKVTNVNNGKSVVVRINDRGPFVRGRIVDLSRSAFSRIALTSSGVINVRIEVVR